jgi:exodeoxyribonuclease VII large subunit
LTANPSLRLSELASKIQGVLDSSFGDLTFWVVADLTNHSYKPQTNYHYFELVEKDAVSSRILAKFQGKAWGNASINISNFEKVTGQRFTNSIQILVQVAVQFNSSYGLQLNLLDVDVNFTLGKFQQQRELTLLKLATDNPSFIQKRGDQFSTRNSLLTFKKVLKNIAVISSSTSAGYQDFIHTLRNNSYNYKFDVAEYFTLVQGDSNARLIIAKLIEIFNSEVKYDAIVLIRGGGSETDFLLFDNYDLCKAIAKFPIPIITGIGHQKNESIADLMAHTSTKTPTKAAELIIEHNKKFEDSILVLHRSILINAQQLMAITHQRLAVLKSYLIRDLLSLLNHHKKKLTVQSSTVALHPLLIISSHKKDLINLSLQLVKMNRNYFITKNQSLVYYTSLIRVMHPQTILNRGFALLRINGDIVQHYKDIKIGNELSIQLANSEIITTVKSKKEL